MSDTKLNEIAYWASKVTGGSISRREFFGRAAALGLAASHTELLFPSIANAAEPKKGGFLRFEYSDGSSVDTLDPATWSTNFILSTFNGSLCNNLTEILPDGTVVGDLAESFESADNASKWVFKLRKGITFHDGKSLTPEDVRQSFLHHMGAESTSGAKALLSRIDSIVTDGPDTIVFNLKSGMADFPFLAADYHLSVMPAMDGGGIDWKRGVGTGSFILEDFEPGQSVKMKRNPSYHKNNKPYLDEFETIVLQDQTARLNALLTGEIDETNDLNINNLSIVEANKSLRVARVPSNRHLTFDMDTSVAPYDNVDVRLALKYAIDRDDIIRKVYLGSETKGNDSPIAPPVPFYKNPTPQFDYDVEKAKYHLKKAGLDKLDVDLSIAQTAFPGAVNAAALFKEHAARAGINVNLINEADDGYWTNVWLKKPFSGCDWFGRPTCDMAFSIAYSADAPYNNTHWKNARFNELLLAARGEADDTKRAAQYAEMQQIVHDDGGLIVVAFSHWVYCLSEKVGHGSIGGAFPADNMRATERWWRI